MLEQKFFRQLIKLTSIAAVVALTASLVACGSSQEKESSSVSEKSAESKTIVVGASPAPHGDILREAQGILKEKGIDLKIKEFNDYALPNRALADKEIQANFFQHVPYLDDYNKKEGTKLAALVAVHFEPLAVYPGKTKVLDALADGASIAVPNDTTNEARSLLLLEAQGLIKLKEGVGLSATPRDIVENNKNLKFLELEAATIPASIKDVDLAVVNGNFALSSGLDPKTALALEDKNSLAAQKYANVLVVNEEDLNNDALSILAEVLTSPEIKQFIEQKYNGTVLPAK